MLKSFHNHPSIDLIIPGDANASIAFACSHLIKTAEQAIAKKGFFSLALSGGSTPKALFSYLAKHYKAHPVFKKTYLFWSDERAVDPTDQESNYHMAMTSGIEQLPIAAENIFRMRAESMIEKNAKEYESLIQEKLSLNPFDLIMLGLGEDGHTASLFPETQALKVKGRLVVENFIPIKNCWRMTLTFDCIEQAMHKVFYIMGKSKSAIVKEVYLDKKNEYPASNVGKKGNKALWILDDLASSILIKDLLE